MRKYHHALLAVFVIFAFPLAGHAYVDPGAGTMLWQLLLGGLAGILFFGRLLKRRILRALGLAKENEKPQ